eukprot:197995_1
MATAFYYLIAIVLYISQCNAEPVIFVGDNVYYAVGLASSIICMILSIMIITWHINGSLKKGKKTNKSKNKCFKFMSIAFAIFSGITHFLWIWDVIDPFNSMIFCQLEVFIFGPNWYALFKGFQAIILVLRLYEVYNNSALGYNRNALLAWGSFLTIWTLFTVIIQDLTTTVELRSNQVPKCHLLVATPFLASMVLFDIVSGIVNGYLFIRPIYKLKTLKNVSAKLSYVAKKQRILSVTAIVSSIIANFGIALIDIPQFNAGFDIVISMTCILLMYSWNEEMYKKICCCCVKGEEDEKNIAAEIIVASGKKSENTSNTTYTDHTINTCTNTTYTENTVTVNANTSISNIDMNVIPNNTTTATNTVISVEQSENIETN